MRKFSAQTPDNCKKQAEALIGEINALPAARISEIDPNTSALVIVDVVNGFIREGAMADRQIEGIIPPIVSLMKKCCGRGIRTVAFADCHCDNCAEFLSFPPHCIENTSESEVADEIKSVGGYTLIKKNSTNGFHEEEFMRFLADNPEISSFIVTGDCTDICVMQLCLALKTLFVGQNKYVNIIIPADCVETYDAPGHDSDFMNIAAYKLMKDSGVKFVSSITAE